MVFILREAAAYSSCESLLSSYKLTVGGMLLQLRSLAGFTEMWIKVGCALGWVSTLGVHRPWVLPNHGTGSFEKITSPIITNLRMGSPPPRTLLCIMEQAIKLLASREIRGDSRISYQFVQPA